MESWDMQREPKVLSISIAASKEYIPINQISNLQPKIKEKKRKDKEGRFSLSIYMYIYLFIKKLSCI